MARNRQRWVWILIACLAIGFALVSLLVPHTHSADSADWLAILPLLFAGIISPLSLLPPLDYEYAGRAPEAPALPTRFQRPPPFRLA